MSNRAMKMTSPGIRKGFTLIEILVVIAILALLAATAWVAKAYIENKTMEKTAATQVGQLETAMNAYLADKGTLPYGKGDLDSASVLYKALSCDDNNDGEPDKGSDGITRMPYCEQLVAIDTKSGEQLQGIPCVKIKHKGKKVFVIMDPWSNPYRYRLGFEQSDGKGRKGKGINPDFDIYSMGPDGQGNNLTPDGTNEDNISNIRSWK